MKKPIVAWNSYQVKPSPAGLASVCPAKGGDMFNDDVLARCPQCGSSDTSVASNKISCSACGFSEPLMIDAQKHEALQRDVANALNMAKARDVLQRWDFAG